VQSGESAQFEKMQAEVLDPLWEKLGELGSGDAVLLAVPGNHDLSRPNPLKDNAAVDVLLEKDGFQRIEAKFWDQPAGAYRWVINDAFAAYSQWWEKAPNRVGDVKTGALPGDFSVTLQCGDRRIGIIGLNTTFLQLAGGNYEGRLVWDARQIHAICDGGVDTWSKQRDVCLLLTHQGPNWLTPEARKQGESEIAPAGRFAVHLFGHQHETDISYIRRGGARNAVRLCQGCSVFGMDKFGEPPKTQRAHGYTAGRIEFGEKEANLRLWPLIATNRTGPWRFIPDYDHADLDDDQATPPETVAIRSRASRPARAKLTIAVVAPVKIASPIPAVSAPHSARPEAVGVSGERLADQAYALAVENGYEYARFPVLEAAWPQLSAALPVLLAGDNGRLQTVCTALFRFLYFAGHWDDLLSLNTEAEARAERTGDLKNAGRRAYETGYGHSLRGQYAEVLTCADRAAAHWQAARAGAHERAAAIRLRGLGYNLARNYPAAVSAYREALDLRRSLSPKSGEIADALNSLAGVFLALGRLDEAETHYREALEIAKALSYPEGVASYTGNLAGLALDREQWPEAERLAGEALKLAEEIGRKEIIAFDDWCLAKALAKQGRGAEGRCHAERAVAVFTELRSPRLVDAQAALADCLA